jgi:hypothetical protein
VYYYTALANFWAQRSLPDPAEFDEENEFHRLTRRIVDSSYPDFQRMARILEAIDQDRLNRNDAAQLLIETRDFWRNYVRSVSDLWLRRAKVRRYLALQRRHVLAQLARYPLAQPW